VADFRYYSDCLSLMTACAMATKRIKVESLVTDPFVRHPTLTACAIATIADLSNGRVILGMGGGVEQPSFWGEDRSRPITALREAVTVIRRMWAGETVDFEGEVVKCHGARLQFPLKYKIPILLVGRGPRALELSGEMADIVHVASLFVNKAHWEENLVHVKRGLEKGGRRIEDVEVDITVTTCVSDDPEKAFRSSKRQSVIGILWAAGADKYAKKNYKDWKPPEEFHAPEKTIEELSKWDWWKGEPLPQHVSDLLTHDLVDQFVINGTPSQVAEKYREIMKYPHVGCIRIPLIAVEGKSSVEGFSETLNGLGKVIKELNG
jgi:5,10-methylenetetrahydromethanopterin reductase